MEYEVRAIAAGKVSTFLVDALDEDDARRQVAAQSCRPLSVLPREGRRGFFEAGGKPSFSLLLFSQQLLTLLDAGLTVVEGLDALLEKERNAHSRNVLFRILQALQEGKSFSRALATMPDLFPPLYASMVRAAERTGDLPRAISRYIDYQLRLDTLKARVASASIYPAILLAVGAVVCLFLLGYVVPRFAGVFQGSGRPLPWLSFLLIEWGNFMAAHQGVLIPAALGGLVVAVAGGRHLWRSGRLFRALQRLPLVATQLRNLQLARLYLTLAMLLDGGLPLVQGLRLVGDLLSAHLGREVAAATRAIEQGESISAALDRHGLADSVAIRMLRVGEQSGRMGEMMARVARLYDAEVNRAIEWFSRVFEPLLMTVIGVVIGGIVVFLYLPVFDLAGTLQ